jgi:hypothetical protein
MTFAAPLYLLVASLALLVLFLHNRRRRGLTVPSVLLWRALQSKSMVAPRILQRPPFSLPLALQIAAVLVAALALARPLIGTDRDPEHWIVVIDASAAMQVIDAGEMENRLMRARAEIETRARASGPHVIEAISVISAGPEADILSARRPFSRAELGGALSLVEVTDGGADWSGAVRLAKAIVRPGEATRVLVATAGSLPEAFATASLSDQKLDLIAVGQAMANRGIRGEITPIDRVAGQWRLSGEVLFSGDAADTRMMVRFRPDGAAEPVDWAARPVERRSSPDSGARTDRVPIDHTITLPGPGLLTLSLEADDAPFDDTARFLIPAGPKAIEVLYIGHGNQPILRALRAVEGVRVATASDVSAIPDQYDLVVIDDMTVSSPPQTHSVWIGSARIRGEAAPAPMLFPDPVTWRNDHPLAETIDWTRIGIETAHAVPQWADARVLLSASDGPLIEARTTAFGREVRIAFDPAASDWPEQTSFPVFVSNIVEWTGLASRDRTSCTVGRPCPIDASVAFGDVVLDGATAPFSEVARDRIATQVKASYQGEFLPERAGIYHFTRGGRAQTIAVNAALGPESELSSPTDAVTEADATRAQFDLWRPMVAVFVALLLVEALAAGRGRERFLSRAALAAANPSSGRLRGLLVARVVAILVALVALLDPMIPVRTAVEHVVLATWTEPPADGSGHPLIARAVAEANAAPGTQRLAVVPMGPSAVQPQDGTGTDRIVLAGAPETSLDALRLAAALLPPDAGGRIVIEDEPIHRLETLQAAIPTLNRRGIAVDYVPVLRPRDPEVLVHRLEANTQLYAGDSFVLTGVIHSNVAQPAEIEVLRDGEPFARQSVALDSGYNRIETLVADIPEGQALLEVAVSADGDTLSANNRSGVSVNVSRPGRVAVIAPDASQGTVFAQALATHGLHPSFVQPGSVPDTLEGWLEYEAIVLMNVPAIDLATHQQELIELAVHEHGLGLLIVGGDRSFGPGGYLETVLERISPISSNVPREAPEVALAFVLDRSGSMLQSVGNVTRLDIAKEATLIAVDLLNEDAQIAIIVFDHEAHLVLPLQAKPTREDLAHVLRRVDPGGGTQIYPGLELAYLELRDAEATAKHVVVMTDGVSRPGDFDTLVPQMRAAGITVSTVAIGNVASSYIVERIADLGGGNFHRTTDFAALPSILSREALMLSGAPVEEIEVVPVWSDRSARFLASLPDVMPAVQGFVRTSPKPEATVAMVAPDSHGEFMPLLAHWRYGNGHVIALSTDGTGAWTRAWQELETYPVFWSEAIRQSLVAEPSPGLHLAALRIGDEITVTLHALDPEGEPLSQVTPRVEVRGPAAADLRLEKTRPGEYRGSFPAAEPGTYVVTVTTESETASLATHVGYPSRLDLSRHENGIEQLSVLSGGRVIGQNDSLFTGATPRWIARSGWQLLFAAALALFLIELYVRYRRPHLPNWLLRRRDAPQVTPPPFRDRSAGII